MYKKEVKIQNGSLGKEIVDVLEYNFFRVVIKDSLYSYTGKNLLDTVENCRPLFKKLSGKQGRIGILMPSSATSAAAALVGMALGYTPVLLDTLATRRDLKKLLRSARLSCLVVQEGYSLPVRPENYHVVRVNGSGVARVEAQTSTQKLSAPRDGTAAILYTSGSSGEPKGIQISSKSICYTANYLIERFELDRNSTTSCVLPICHTMGFNTQFLPTFFARGTCDLSPASQNLASMYRRILKGGSSFLGLISELVRFCHEEKNRKKLPPARKVKHVQLAGGFIRKEHLDMARELFPNATIHKGYGLTEAIRVSMIDSRDPNFYKDTAGYLLPGHEVEVRNEKGEVLPEGSVGRLFVKGPNVMLGYDNVLSPYPLDERGFLNTGDLVSISDNRLVIHGRHDSIFKVKGKRVSGKEIETVVRSLTTSFLDVKCSHIHCQRRGARPILFLEMNDSKIIDFLAKEKMSFEMKLKKELEDNGKVPKDMYLVYHFPRTANGKLKYGELNEVLGGKKSGSGFVSALGKDRLGFHFYMVSFLGAPSNAIEEAFSSAGVDAG